MEGNARRRFTPSQRAELWDRWKNGQCVADIARAATRKRKRPPEKLCWRPLSCEMVSDLHSYPAVRKTRLDAIFLRERALAPFPIPWW